MNDLTNVDGFTVEAKIHFQNARKGRKRIRRGPAPPEGPKAVPRLSRLLALAIRFEGLLAAGEVRDYADLARLGQVTRARMTQVMNLLNLAPGIQEEILFLPPTTNVRDAIPERRVRLVAAIADWHRQRLAWDELKVIQESTRRTAVS